MNDLTKKLLQEYKGIVSKRLQMAQDNLLYCKDCSRKYGTKHWQESVDKWVMRCAKHESKLAEIETQLN